MKIILLMVCCLVALINAIPLNDPTKEVYTTNLDSNGPQPVDEIIAVTNDNGKSDSLKRVARHYGGVSIGIGIPVVGYGYGYPVYGGGYPYYGGYGGYGYGGYGYRGYGYGGRHHHHHHRHYWR